MFSIFPGMIYQFKEIKPSLPDEYYIAENATVIGDVVLKNQSSVWFGAVLRGDIEPIILGERSNIQDNSVAHTGKGAPTIIGDDVTVGHAVTLHGCTVGDNCLIGMGSILLDRCEIGDNCIIGAGSIIAQGKTIPSGSLAVGSPARVIRKLTEDDFINIRSYAERYVENMRRYRGGIIKPC
ncbi:gamma carbonic anhydrase family protein [Pontiella agarivorans]|uniref:Gamma carbonic anhydrase family protein n=1 Tax=Pontiella agarivorans TaxID=3038953 RepID=A0ABU5MWQ4_9BACT|nr:gamma carbonic anhydrase family protein [Pontiella agarivorans]MDZ8118623.1 gamma carbonic anhydrase family protein [Pontiella agarivorans]